MAVIKKILRSQKGVSLIEFSITFPVFLFIAFGAMDTFLIQMQNLKIYDFAQESVRTASVKSLKCQTGDDPREEAIVKAKTTLTQLMNSEGYEFAENPKICIKPTNNYHGELSVDLKYKYNCIFCIYPNLFGADYNIKLSYPLENDGGGNDYFDSNQSCSEESKCI